MKEENKKAFTLFSTLVLVFIFSILITTIFEIKSISSTNITNQYYYIQAKNHMVFLKNYIDSISNLNNINKVEIKNDKFYIYSNIKKNKMKYLINLYVKAKDLNISLHEKITK